MNAFINKIGFGDDFKFLFSNVIETLMFTYSIIMVLAPQKDLEWYNELKDLVLNSFKKPESKVVLECLTQRSSLAMSCCCACHLLMVPGGMNDDRYHVIGITLIPWVVTFLHALLNDVGPKEHGNSSSRGELASLIVISITIFSIFTESQYMTFALNLLLGYMFSHGILFYLYPKALNTLYGTPERDEHIYFARRMFGSSISNLGVVYTTMIRGVHWQNILIISWICFLIGFLGVLKDCQKLNMPMGSIYGWLLFIVAVILVLSI